jgi:hypothetical protein
MAKILFVHHFFPGQFGFIATALVEAGNEVVALGGRTASPISCQQLSGRKRT